MDPTSHEVPSPHRLRPADTAGFAQDTFAQALPARQASAPLTLVSSGPGSSGQAPEASGRALALARVGRHEEADREMASALAGGPDCAWAHLRRARLHLIRGDVAGMGTAVRRAMETTESPLTARQRAMAEALLSLG